MTNLSGTRSRELHVIDSAEGAWVPVDEEMSKKAKKFNADFEKLETKLHRFPASLQGLGRRYIVPATVSIGPYHHGEHHLREMEEVKRVVAYQFSRDSGHAPEEIHEAILSVTGVARSLYADDAVAAGIDDSDFAAMMFRDGCFLLQFMIMRTGTSRYKMNPPSLRHFFYSNRACINNDIMLLENQLPWLVVETLLRFRHVPVEEFIVKMGDYFEFHGHANSEKKPVLDGSYRPPHLLGLFRFFKTGGDATTTKTKVGLRSISAIELAEIGVKLTKSKTTKFTDMGFMRGRLSGRLFMAPLLLNELKACWLVNMAAFEVCTATNFWEADQKTAVSSYLALLSMLVDREEDVHRLRTKRLVYGELTNKEMLDFFKGLTKYLYGGPRYFHIMVEIEDYKLNRWMWIKMHKFVYRNLKTIVTVFSLIGVLVGIFKTLISLKQHQQ